MKRKVVIVLEDSEEGFSRQMYVEPPLPADIAEAAPTAGLMQTSSANLGDWSASRLVQPKSKAAGRHS